MPLERESWLQGLERPLEERLLGGVCAGLSIRLSIDVTLLRLAMLLLALASGLGLLIYLVGWLVIPQRGADLPLESGSWSRILYSLRSVEHDLRRTMDSLAGIWRRQGRSSGWPRPLTRKWVALGLVVVGSLIVLQSLGLFSWLGPMRSLGLAIVAVGAGVLVASRPR